MNSQSPFKNLVLFYWQKLKGKIHKQPTTGIPGDIAITITASTSIIFDNGIDEFVELVTKAARQAAIQNASAFFEKYG